MPLLIIDDFGLKPLRPLADEDLETDPFVWSQLFTLIPNSAARGRISVQVLNEFAAVATCKLGLSWAEIGEAVDVVRAVCPVEPLTVETHERARRIAERYGFRFYDALIVFAALLAGCKVLYSAATQA